MYSFMPTVIIISLFKETITGIPSWMNESIVVMSYLAINEQADDEDVVGGGAYSFMPTIIITSLFKGTVTGTPSWMNVLIGVMSYLVISEQADDEDVGGGEWFSLHWFFRFMGNFMEMNKVFDWVTKQLEQQTGTHGTALPWASSNFTQETKDFCKKNPLPLSFISFIYLLVVLVLVY